MPRSKKSLKVSTALPKILIIAGILLVVVVILVSKNKPVDSPDLTQESPEVQLDRHLEERRPVFVFFHSNNCQSCIDMIQIVNQVYPEFKDKVALVDVNVYDATNENLLKRARINSIPTQVFIDATGQGKMAMGVMTPDQLRQQLQMLAGGNK